MEASLTKICDAVCTGTQYWPSTAGMNVLRMKDIGLVIQHPSGGTATYTIEASNLSDEEILRGGNDWHEYTMDEPIGELTAAENLGVDIDEFSFARMRVKTVSTVDAATATVIRAAAKGK